MAHYTSSKPANMSTFFDSDTNKMAYTAFVTEILKVPSLAEAVNDMSKSLNLVTPDWEKDLKNSITYQTFENQPGKCFRPAYGKSDKFTVYRLKDTTSVKLLLAFEGYYLYDKNNVKASIRVLVSEPLEQLYKVMIKNVDDNFKISNEFRFFMDSCDV
ncbi:hypothetical protein AVEN_158039-1 [Araneus ventricosus]|uniref:Uncharacterized protein n=1 Tax=Araneus ventricosus TaxID=182803 RepID=A0A4Y2RN51_ARAVE|nr:hypothetical protein AVEN_158039-1 [Araneus ventricosus]